MRVITISSFKGGTAKTSTSLHLGAALAKFHKEKVLLIDFDAQAARVFANVRLALESAGASWKNVVQFTTYLTDAKWIEGFMAYRRREFPRMYAGAPYPPNTLLIIDRLVREEFLIEVQAIAAI